LHHIKPHSQIMRHSMKWSVGMDLSRQTQLAARLDDGCSQLLRSCVEFLPVGGIHGGSAGAADILSDLISCGRRFRARQAAVWDAIIVITDERVRTEGHVAKAATLACARVRLRGIRSAGREKGDEEKGAWSHGGRERSLEEGLRQGARCAVRGVRHWKRKQARSTHARRSSRN